MLSLNFLSESELFGGGLPCPRTTSATLVVLHIVATWVVGSRKRWAAAQTGEQPVSSTFLKDIFNKNIFWKNESCTPLILNCWYFSFSSFTTLTSLLKLWQPLQIRFDISMNENEKLYFDFFCRGKMGRHVQADDAAGHDIERLSILRHIVCTNRRYYAKENTLKIKFRNL